MFSQSRDYICYLSKRARQRGEETTSRGAPRDNRSRRSGDNLLKTWPQINRKTFRRKLLSLAGQGEHSARDKRCQVNTDPPPCSAYLQHSSSPLLKASYRK